MTDGFKRFLDNYSEINGEYLHTYVQTIRAAIPAIKVLKMEIFSEKRDGPTEFIGDIKHNYKSTYKEDDGKAIIELENKAMIFLMRRLCDYSNTKDIT